MSLLGAVIRSASRVIHVGCVNYVVTDVTAAGQARAYPVRMAGGDASGRKEQEMTRLVRTACQQAQTTAVAALCLAASLALPLALALIGFQAA